MLEAIFHMVTNDKNNCVILEHVCSEPLRKESFVMYSEVKIQLSVIECLNGESQINGHKVPQIEVDRKSQV